MTNTRNRRRLVLLCYFLAGLNNKFINGLKPRLGISWTVQVYRLQHLRRLQEQASVLGVKQWRNIKRNGKRITSTQLEHSGRNM